MKKIVIISFIILSVTFGQKKSPNSGLILETSIMLTENSIENVQFVLHNGMLVPLTQFENQKKIYAGFGVYYSCEWMLGRDFSFELRPGIFGSQKLFSGAQLGVYIRKYFAEEYFAALGVVSELHLGDGGHSYDPTTITGTLGLTVGRKVLENLLVHLSFHKPVNTKYGKFNDSTINKKVYGYLYSVFKFGIEIDF